MKDRIYYAVESDDHNCVAFDLLAFRTDEDRSDYIDAANIHDFTYFTFSACDVIAEARWPKMEDHDHQIVITFTMTRQGRMPFEAQEQCEGDLWPLRDLAESLSSNNLARVEYRHVKRDEDPA